MDKIEFQNKKLPAVNGPNLNQLQENIDKAKYEKSGGLIDGECIVADISSKNKFNISTTYDKIGSSTTYSIDGSKLTVTGKWFIGCLIKVKPNTDYYCSFNRLSSVGRIRIMDKDETTSFGYSESSFGFNTGNSTEIRMYIYSNPAGTDSQTAIYENIQLEEGTTATDYCEYINFENIQNIITGNELATNEYIDGKQVYMKRINCGTLPNASQKAVAHGVSGFVLIDIKAVFSGTSGDRLFVPYVNPNNVSESIALGLNNNNIYLTTAIDYSSYTGYVTMYYTKT